MQRQGEWQAGKLAPKKYGKQVLFEGEVKQFNAYALILQQFVKKPELLAEFTSDKGNLALLADALRVPEKHQPVLENQHTIHTTT